MKFPDQRNYSDCVSPQRSVNERKKAHDHDMTTRVFTWTNSNECIWI